MAIDGRGSSIKRELKEIIAEVVAKAKMKLARARLKLEAFKERVGDQVKEGYYRLIRGTYPIKQRTSQELWMYYFTQGNEL